MKLRLAGWLIVVSFVLLRNAPAQDFVNLDFEDATIVPDPSFPSYLGVVYANQALPGWTKDDDNLGPADILYNDFSVGTPNVSLVGLIGQAGPSPLDGLFDIFLQAYSPWSVSISQTGLVPASAKSLQFIARHDTPAGTLQVSLGGQNLSFYALSSGVNYTLYGADISGFAGQTEQLTFSALQGSTSVYMNFWDLDDIQFSPSSVPEPSTLGLIALGGLLFGLRRSR